MKGRASCPAFCFSTSTELTLRSCDRDQLSGLRSEVNPGHDASAVRAIAFAIDPLSGSLREPPLPRAAGARTGAERAARPLPHKVRKRCRGEAETQRGCFGVEAGPPGPAL